MKIGVLSDAHGNTIALNACIQFLKNKVDQIYFLGDSCGYFPDVDGVVELLEENKVKSILGNHDAMLLGRMTIDEKKDAVYQLSKSKQTMRERTRVYLNSLDTFYTFESNNLKVLMVHGSPTNHLKEYVYEDSDLSQWKDVDADVVLMGHTHRSFIKTYEGKYFINVGSCGLPRDNGNLFSMAILDLNKKEYTLEKVKLAVDDIIETYPTVHDSVKSCLKRNNV